MACEWSGTVRTAFARRGHWVMSCDLESAGGGSGGFHYRGDVFDLINGNDWDLMIAHPPCRYLCVSGNRWMNHPLHLERGRLRDEAVEFFMKLYNAPISRVCIENPVGVMSTVFRRPDQYIQPYEFGHPETKKTGLWLRNLPELKPTKVVKPEYIIGKDGKRYSRVHYLSKWSSLKNYGMSRGLVRGKTYYGIAEAMADQWG